MIITGNPAGSVSYWSAHLMRDDTNSVAEVKEISGLVAEDLPDALREMQAVAAGSRSCGNFMYQANINPQRGEQLTPEQWKEAVDTLERNLGLEGHQRVVVEHVKDGRQHYHVIWNRVDVDTMRVADMGGNWRVHESTARELEARLELAPTPTRAPAERGPTLELWEQRAAERSGIDPKVMKAELTELWRASDSGTAFVAAVEDRGYIVARGDRRDFCIVDAAGDAHSLARRLDGVKAAEVRAVMSDVDREALPSVAEARAEQRAPREFLEQNVADLAAPDRTVATNPVAVPERALLETQLDTDTAPSGSHAMAALEGSAIQVTDRVADGVVSLGEAIADIFGGGPSYRPSENQVERILQQRRAEAALDRIADDLKDNRPIARDDLISLSPQHLREMKEKGDDYLHQLVQRLEEERAQSRDLGGGRER